MEQEPLPKAPAPRSGSPDLGLFLAFLFVLALNLPQLRAGVVPVNDTFYNLANFHIFYSELLFHGARAAWLPYEGFGIQADYEQLIAIAPSNYLVAALGWIFRATDVLLLFKIAVLLEQLAFVFGIHVLARHLFPTRATRWALCIAAAGTTIWYSQQWWDLRIYYLLPIVLFFLLRFFDLRRPSDLWLAGLTGVAWSIGNLPYLIPLWTLLLLSIAVMLMRDRRIVVALFTPSRANVLGFALFALAAGVYLYFAAHALDHTILRAADRDPLTGKVDPEVFRSYGGKGNFVTVLNALLFGWPIHLPWGAWADNSAYLGILPMIGLGIALVRERSRVFVTFVAAAVLLAWLSFGGVGTQLAWYLPGLAYFRHVGLVFGLVKVLLLVAAGFGLERLWRAPPPKLTNPLLWLVGGIIAIEALVALPSLPAMTTHAWVLRWGHHALVRSIFYGIAIVACRFGSWRSLGVALTLALAADVATFQVAVFDKVSQVGPRIARDAIAAREPIYRETRIDLPQDPVVAAERIDDPRQRAAFQLATRKEVKETYAYVYQLANVDPCRDHYRNDAHLGGVDPLLDLERAGLSIAGVVGCGSPKLYLAPSVRAVEGSEVQRNQVAAALMAGETRPTIVQGDAGPPPGADAASGDPGSVRVTYFSLGALEADVEVRVPGGAWLVYADAFHPAWRARVDGVETPIQRANLAFKALRVPEGRSTVRFEFEGTPLGHAVAGLGLAFALAWLGWVLAVLAGRR